MFRMTHWLAVFFMLGCSSSDKIEWKENEDDNGSSPFPDGSDEHHGLPNLVEDLDTDGCDVQEATDVAGPGATSYFYGEFWKESGDWIGYEQFIFFANETWAENGGEDCRVEWSLTATEGDDIGFCGGCDLALDVTAVLNATGSNCPEGTVGEQDQTFSVTYGLIRQSNGDALWYFAESGDALSEEGYHFDSAMNYISAKSCRWF